MTDKRSKSRPTLRHSCGLLCQITQALALICLMANCEGTATDSTTTPSQNAPLLELRHGSGYGIVFCLAWSPDGKYLASGADDGTLRLWEVSTGRLHRTIDAHSEALQGIAFLQDGSFFTAGWDHIVSLWDWPELSLHKTLEGSEDSVFALAVEQNEGAVAAGGHDHIVRVWNLSDGRLVHSLAGHSKTVYDIALRGDKLYSVSKDKSVRAWDWKNDKEIWHWDKCFGGARSIALSSDGALIAVGETSQVHLIDPDTGTLFQTVHLPDAAKVTGLAFLPDDTQLVVGSDLGSAVILDIARGDTRPLPARSMQRVASVAVSPDGSAVAVGGSDRRIVVVQLDASEPNESGQKEDRRDSLP